MSTSTGTESIQKVLEKGDLNDLSEALKKVGGKRHSVIKVVVSGLTADINPDITGALVKAAATITGIDTLKDGEMLPPVGSILSLRVTAGTAAAGDRIVTDVGGTASATVATIDDTGEVITFEDVVTAFVLQYVPRSEIAPTTLFAPTT
jgi:hypothetical protein